MTILRPSQKVPFSKLADTPTELPPRPLRRIGRALLIGLAVLICLAGTGMVYQAIGTALDRRNFVPPGRLVAVDGHLMHLHCTGVGSPTVILESGAGAPSSMWAWVQPVVAQQTRVCSYDRLGLGWSDSGPHPRDAASIARDLHELLLRAGESGPFVLAGHSLGGQYAHMFAEHYGADTADLVLIDAQHPDTMFRLPAAQAIQRQDHRGRCTSGVLRLVELTETAQAQLDACRQERRCGRVRVAQLGDELRTRGAVYPASVAAHPALGPPEVRQHLLIGPARTAFRPAVVINAVPTGPGLPADR